MTTLKQIMDEYNVPENIQISFNSYVKEWLQQKQQEDKYANFEDWGGSEAKAVYIRLLEDLE